MTNPTDAQTPPRRRTFPNDYWIVTSHDFQQHLCVEAAYVERAKLKTLYPGKEFRVVHCKRRIDKNEQSCEVIARLQAEIKALEAELRKAVPTREEAA